MRLLVGCPVRDRAWLIEQWIDHVEAAAELVGVEPEYLFVADPDDPTSVPINAQLAALGRTRYWSYASDEAVAQDHRWNPERYRQMVDLRNRLLDVVRRVEPDLFLSLDSDVLLARPVLANLVELALDGNWQAVGAKCYLSPSGYAKPSYANLVGSSGGFHRMERDDVIPVDVLMAIVLMTPAAYAVDYRFDRNGEDFGWALGCRSAGLHLGWDGRIASRHVWGPDFEDIRCP